MSVRNMHLAIYGSFLAGLILTLLPMPGVVVGLGPQWLLLVLLYWLIAEPQKVSVGTAWCVGLIYDVLNGVALGESALAFTLIAYVVVRLQRQIRHFPLWQQAVLVAALVTIYQGLIFAIQGWLGGQAAIWLYYWSSVTSALLWPVLTMLLAGWQQRMAMQ